MWFSINILSELILYLLIDNITKYFLIHNNREDRFDILISECFLLGFFIGFISFYHHLTYLLFILLLIHLIGTLYTEYRFILFRQVYEIIFEFFRLLFHRFITIFTSRTLPKFSINKKLPDKFLYNYPLTPTSDLRIQQSSANRPGIINLYGTTCSLNALLQSLASLNNFCLFLQRNINFSRFNYDSIVSSFLDILFQLRNNHSNWNRSIDTSSFISRLSLIEPSLLTKTDTTDIVELFQKILDVLNNALAKQTSVCSTNVIEQVQNRKLTTFSLNYLNKIFLETETQLHNRITLDNLDAQASYIIQYIDLTWLLHHIQLGSIIKSTFSGQILHAHCCTNCSHIQFRSEPFQILPITIDRRETTLERLLSQFTNIEIIDSISCSYCSSQISNKIAQQSETFFTKLTSSLFPGDKRNQSLRIHSSISRIKSQTMIANFPYVLCLQLKRFSYDQYSHQIIKLTTKILIEPDKLLDLSNIHYTTWLGLTNTFQTIPSRYRLIAICLHLSKNRTNTIDGHYVCLYRAHNSRWFLSDDEHMTEINFNENIFQSSYVTDNCYLLFYEHCL